MKKKVLFITPQVVYPQYDGGKKSCLGRIMESRLAGNEVHVVSFNVMGQDEAPSIEFFRKHRIRYLTVKTSSARKRGTKLGFLLGYFTGIFSHRPRFIQNHLDPECAAVIHALIERESIDDVVFDSLWVTEAADMNRMVRPLLVATNVEYVYLKDRAKCESNPVMKFLLYFESLRTYFYEKKMLRSFPAIEFLSDYDMAFAVSRFGIAKKRCRVSSNYIFFEKKVSYRGKGSYLLFSGSLTFEPNLEGCRWFLKNVFPAVRKAHPGLTLRITGSVSGKVKEEILSYGSVEFAGLISDAEMLKTIADCRCIVSPILSGSGVKIKNIEALQLGIPIVMTEFSARGIPNAKKIAGFCKTNEPAEFTAQLLKLLSK